MLITGFSPREWVTNWDAVRRGPAPPTNAPLFHLPAGGRRRYAGRSLPSAFTLVELLVTITIIGILTGLTFGALQLARQAAREAQTRATIAKLHTIIMRRYESYLTRRVPIQIPPGLTLRQAAEVRLSALREIIRMEMPERWSDIITPAQSGNNSLPDLNGTVAIKDLNGTPRTQLPRTALSRLYAQRYLAGIPDTKGEPGYGPAECLYLLVSLGCPEEMEKFNQNEIGDVDGDGYPEFIDGWGRPIMFLRWAPGFSSYSPIQQADPNQNHDPFDFRRVHQAAYHLIPLIYSAGRDGKYGLNVSKNYIFSDEQDPFGSSGSSIGAPTADDGSLSDFKDNITNHDIEVR